MIQRRILKIYKPHPGQQVLHASRARFRVAACGRRWGKTVASTAEIVKHAWEEPGSLSFWVAPVYRQSSIAFDLVRNGLSGDVVKTISRENRRIVLANGSIIEFRSAHLADTLRGFGVDFLVVDETAFLPRGLWEEVLRPTLADRHGRALLVGTPKGKNWFYGLFARGRDNKEENWASFCFPTESNPNISKDEIEEAQRTLPDRVFRQEYQARFVEDGAGVFSHVHDAVRANLADPSPGRRYIGGLDVARLQDYTVLVILDDEGALVYFDRFRRTSWGVMKSRVAGAVKKYHNAIVWMDSTGVGDPIFEDLRRMDLTVRGVTFSARNKEAIIEHLALGLEGGHITLAPIPELIDELMLFEGSITTGGGVRYGAPPGGHDDCVIALGLAWWGMRGGRISGADFEHIGF
ncbi:MAG: terminase family protein [Deltaproteobacteria bacterium]|nr:terminase family protein [Candidatus Zymogenaceae bacterium]